MELPSLDLNLVVVLDALLQERNVTRAGERVGLSQPGASAALARLRRHFGDQLLVRQGSQYELTPLAHGLRDELTGVVEHLQRLLTARPVFEEATAERDFVLQCSDSVLDVLGGPVIRAVTGRAPRVRLDFRAMTNAVVTDPITVLRDLDVVIAPRGLFSLPDLPHLDLYADRWVCVTWRGNDAVGDRLTEAEARRAPWVMPFREVARTSPADAALAALGIDRHCTVRVENFTTLGRLVAGTPLLALVHERVYRQTSFPELREVELPVAIPPVTETAWWHPSKGQDPGHQWLRDRLRTESEALAALPEPPSHR